MTEAKFVELDLAKVGDKLMRLVIIARQLGHVRLRGTAEDYGHPQSPEMQFVQDTFTLTTPEIIDKWFGGDEETVRLTSAMLNQASRKRPYLKHSERARKGPLRGRFRVAKLVYD